MLYSIQFLRGIAALMVVIAHVAHKEQQYGIHTLNWYHVGGSGVDLFFIISGFIMCYTTYNKKINFLTFFKNRIERIIPLYWLLSFLALIIFLISPSLVNSSGGKTSIINSFFLIPNGNKFLIQNGWTLSYEFLYYFIFSLFILTTNKDYTKHLGISISIILLVALGKIVYFSNPLLLFITNNILLEFLFGIISFIIFKKIILRKTFSYLLIFSGISLLILKNNFDIYLFNFGRSIYFGIPMFLIFTGFISIEDFFKKFKNFILKLFENLGNSSYSLYLIHPFILSPVAIILNKLNINNGIFFSLTLTILSVISGFFVYIYLEKPINKYIKSLNSKN